MSETLLFIVVLALTFAYGWFLRGKYTPRPKGELSERKKKFLLWYVRREIKKFDKKHGIKNRKEQIAFFRADKGKYVNSAEDRARLEQLMKWEYSLKTAGQFGEDFTFDKTRVRNYSKNWLEPTREQYAKWSAVSKETPLLKLNNKPLFPSNKYWFKTTNGKTKYITDAEYQALRKSAGLPPRDHWAAGDTIVQDEKDRKYLEDNARTSK